MVGYQGGTALLLQGKRKAASCSVTGWRARTTGRGSETRVLPSGSSRTGFTSSDRSGEDTEYLLKSYESAAERSRVLTDVEVQPVHRITVSPDRQMVLFTGGDLMDVVQDQNPE